MVLSITSQIRKPLYSIAVKTVRCFRKVHYKVDSQFHSQKMEYACPCCGIRLRRFVSGRYKDYPQRFNLARYEHTEQNVLCPLCRSLPRHRILACWCNDNAVMMKSSKILYFAPEYSMTLWMKRNKVKCTTADLFSKANLKIDIQETGLEAESFDVIICNHVLEHVDDFRKALVEMKRILRKNGAFICSFPMDPAVELLDEDPTVCTAQERLQRYGQDDHKRVFGMKADQFLREAGFEVEKIDGAYFPDEIKPFVGPANYDMNVLFCCRKKQ